MISSIVWHLPRPSRSKYPGSFPLYFEENLVKLLGYPERILHPFGGMAETGTRVDLDPTVNPDVIGDANDLPFEDASFDCVVLDPPYSDEEGLRLYDSPGLRRSLYMAEALRVLRPGGWLVVYGDREPDRPRGCNPAMRIIVIIRHNHRPRIALVFQKRKPGMPYYATEADELESPG